MIIHREFKDSTSSFIPDLNGVIAFESDTLNEIIFDEVTTTHNLIEYDECEETRCCDHSIRQESKMLIYRNKKEHLTIQISANGRDSIDEFFIVMGSNCYVCPSNFANTILYVPSEDIKNILNHRSKRFEFNGTLIISNKKFFDVYTCKNQSSGLDKKYAEEIYYNKNKGIIGFMLNDKSTWLKK